MYLVITASPNSDGLTAACAAAALEGFTAAGVDARQIDLCTLKLALCRQCGNGWGQCLAAHTCVIDDGFNQLHQQIIEAEGLVIVSPVYWGEMAESAKNIFDRLRRCEAIQGDGSALKGMPIIAVAAAGGTGGGVASCLASMERFVQHTRARVFDLIGIMQRSRAYTLDTIRSAASAMAQAKVKV